MLINDVLARDKAPRSTTSTSELVRTIARKFEQELARVVGDVGCEDLTAMRFEGFLSEGIGDSNSGSDHPNPTQRRWCMNQIHANCFIPTR